MATIILGTQWGNEGKGTESPCDPSRFFVSWRELTLGVTTGKLADLLINEDNFQLCARAGEWADPQAGLNASVLILMYPKQRAEYVLHILPETVSNAGTKHVLMQSLRISTMPGIRKSFAPVALAPAQCRSTLSGKWIPSFFKELETLEAKGLSGVRDRILVSDRCHVNLDLHAAVDGLEEIELGERQISTTGRGIGPAYSTKAARSGIRVHDIFDQEAFESKLRTLAEGYRKRFGDLLNYDVDDEIQRFRQYRPKLAEFCVDAVHLILNMQKHNAKILVEGANALMLDIDYGTYPSSRFGRWSSDEADDQTNPSSSVKTTRVGEGIFKTEDHGEIGAKLQTIGREWGASTERKRRCGWIDLVVLKYSIAINDYTYLNLSKLDVLDTFPVIKLAVAYKDPETGMALENFPADLNILERCEVVYHEMEGWQQPITHIRTFDALPEQAKAYVRLIEQHCGVPVIWISTGPGREDMIRRPLPAHI
ncbi:hypothetical protein NUW58_g8264 [Xylaria curta]|uniref:Uncharacterized protein n=1 Tax=Xylaria curta TaxID=42375 RepID=A0ACC1NBE8_9PEZI|nr:hypothetical protein NUW58_g8264 [Xylaria curta]